MSRGLAERKRALIAHRGVLDELLDRVAGGAQHTLILGRRGMGCTTLLHALADAVGAHPELSQRWTPIVLEGPSFGIGDLCDLWLDVLGVLSSVTGDPSWRSTARSLQAEHRGDALEEAARMAVLQAPEALRSKLLILIDHLDAVLDRVGGDHAHHRLREVLQHAPGLLLIGTSDRIIEATAHYDRPLYQHLAVLPLQPLDDGSAVDLLQALAARDGRDDLAARVEALRPRVHLLRAVLDGNVGAMCALYDRWRAAEPSPLRAVLAGHDDRFRREVSALAPQTQRVLHALADAWIACTAHEVADAIRLARGPVSAQLSRLRDRGLVEQVEIQERAVGWRLRERRLQLWFMLNSRRHGARVQHLAWWIDRAEADPTEPGSPHVAPPSAALERAAHAHAQAEAHPERWRAHAEVAHAELTLRRATPARDALLQAIALWSPRRGSASEDRLLGLMMELARADPRSALEAMQGSGLGERWFPVEDALRSWLNAPAGWRARLPVERRLLAEEMLSTLKLRGPDAAHASPPLSG